MKNLKTIYALAFLILGLQLSVSAQQAEAPAKFKKYVNKIVDKVEKAENADKKRQILNDSFDKMITAFDNVSAMSHISEDDRTAINELKADIIDKKNELNGLDGYDAVKNNQLNHFAKYVQQDMEQADEKITISVTVLLLIVIILLLL